MLTRCEKVVDVYLPRRSNNVMRFERAVGAANDGVQFHRGAMAYPKQQPFAGERIEFGVGLDHEFYGRISQNLLAQSLQRFGIKAKGRTDLVEGIEKVVERIDRNACLGTRRTTAEVGEETARTPHRPGRGAERAGFFFGNEFRRAHECILIMCRAVGK